MAESKIAKTLRRMQRFYVSQQFTVSGNGVLQVEIDMSSQLSALADGYILVTERIIANSGYVVATNYWITGAKLYVTYRNLTGNQVTTTASCALLAFW